MHTLAMIVCVIAGLFLWLMYQTDISAGGHFFSPVVVIAFEALFIIVFIAMWKGRKEKKASGSTTDIHPPMPNPFVDVSYYDRSEFPVVNYPNLVLREGEKLIYAAPAAVFTEKEKVVGYTGGSAGVSMRVTRGLTVRQGASRGTPVRERVKDFFGGDYIVTNQRLVFVSPQKPFDINLKKVSAVHNISEGDIFTALSILAGNTVKNVWVEYDQIKYALMCTMFAVDFANGRVLGEDGRYYTEEEALEAGMLGTKGAHNEKRYCSSCGALLSDNSKFCSSCGAKVE